MPNLFNQNFENITENREVSEAIVKIYEPETVEILKYFRINGYANPLELSINPNKKRELYAARRYGQ